MPSAWQSSTQLAYFCFLLLPTSSREANNPMGPLTVITGILLGSSIAIAFSLAAVLVMFLLVGNDDPKLSLEFPGLIRSLLLFTGMTAISAASFYLMVRRHRARWSGQLLLWAALAGTACYYWP
jgi:hypothetical protein